MSKIDDTANSKPAFLDFLRPKRESVTEDEIKDMVAENIELLEDEKRMINDILDLADMTVREIMKPRVDMIMAEDTESARAALDRMRGTGYSRLPVYHEEVDEVIGLVSYKDLIGPLLDGRIEDPVAEFMYEPLYVPETKNVLKLLSELQEARMQMAIVVDEYGGTDGLITMEDIIEEIVGEIADRDPTTIATSLCLSSRTSGASTAAFPWRMPWNSAGPWKNPTTTRRLRAGSSTSWTPYPGWATSYWSRATPSRW